MFSHPPPKEGIDLIKRFDPKGLRKLLLNYSQRSNGMTGTTGRTTGSGQGPLGRPGEGTRLLSDQRRRTRRGPTGGPDKNKIPSLRYDIFIYDRPDRQRRGSKSTFLLNPN